MSTWLRSKEYLHTVSASQVLQIRFLRPFGKLGPHMATEPLCTYVWCTTSRASTESLVRGGAHERRQLCAPPSLISYYTRQLHSTRWLLTVCCPHELHSPGIHCGGTRDALIIVLDSGVTPTPSGLWAVRWECLRCTMSLLNNCTLYCGDRPQCCQVCLRRQPSSWPPPSDTKHSLQQQLQGQPLGYCRRRWHPTVVHSSGSSSSVPR